MSCREVEFRVDGKPEPKGSARAVKSRSTGKAVLLMGGDARSGRRLKSWATKVAWAAKAVWRGEPARGAVEIGIQFWMPGKSCRPPDLDKLQRAVLDALTGIVYVDDAQVVEIEAGKAGPSTAPGALIRVRAEVDA